MIRVNVFYPDTQGSRFDMAYYCERHIPMVLRKLGAACKGATVEQGLGGGQPGARPPFVAMVHLAFDSVEASQAAFGPHEKEIMGDVPNYTDIAPVIQISEVKM